MIAAVTVSAVSFTHTFANRAEYDRLMGLDHMRDEIRKWFLDHEDGDFAILPQDHPYAVVPAPARSQCVLYTTKAQSLLAALSGNDVEMPCGVVGRYGLPAEDDVDFIKALVGKRQFVFVGDADPCDLLIFAWLRSWIDISFRGVNDLLCELCGASLDERRTIAQSDAESAAMPLVARCVGDYTSLVGSNCARVLAAGRKVEVESLVATAMLNPKALADAVCT